MIVNYIDYKKDNKKSFKYYSKLKNYLISLI